MHARRGRRRAQLPEDGPAVQEAVPGRLRRGRPLLSPWPAAQRVARRAARWRAAADRRTRSDLAEDGARGLRQHGREPPGCEGEEGRDRGARRCDLGRRRDRRQPRPAEHRAASRLPGGDHARRERDRDPHVRRPGPAAPGSGAARPRGSPQLLAAERDAGGGAVRSRRARRCEAVARRSRVAAATAGQALLPHRSGRRERDHQRLCEDRQHPAGHLDDLQHVRDPSRPRQVRDRAAVPLRARARLIAPRTRPTARRPSS